MFFGLPTFAPLHPFRKKGYAYKLTPREEGAGGGWDGKIIIPKGMGAESRVIFIQYKRGYHSDGNNDPKSIFNTKKIDPNMHVKFSFNSDTNKNQHLYLKNLVDDLASKGKSNQIVMYGFPRLTTKTQFEELGGNLLQYTTFLSMAQMDDEAKKAKVDLYDNEAHTFRTCYFDINKREICSEPFKLASEDRSIEVLYEIIALKVGSFWNSIIDYENPYLNTRYLDIIKDEIKLIVADYLKIDPFIELDNQFSSFRNLYERGDLNHFKENATNRLNIEKELFPFETKTSSAYNFRSNLFLQLAKFIDEFGEKKIDLNKQVPSIFTQPINDGINLNLNDWETDATLSYLII